MIGVILLAIFFIFFVVFIIFVAMADKQLKKAKCGLYKLPGSLLDGINEPYTKFIGTENL